VGEALKGAEFEWILAGYVQMLAMFWLQAMRWKVMLRIPGLSTVKFLHFIFVGLFYRVILPGSFSADLLKVVLFGRKYKKPLHESGLVFFSQILGMGIQVLLGTLGLFFYGPALWKEWQVAELSKPKLAVIGLILVAALMLPFLGFVRSFILRLWGSIREALSASGVLSRIIVLTVGIQILTLGAAYCLFRGAGIEIPPLMLCLQMSLAIMLSVLPISINGIGVVEYLNLALLQKPLGIAAGSIIAVSVIGYALLVWNALLGGAWMLFRNATDARSEKLEPGKKKEDDLP
jgi:uncharacterized membrane protein YbhN (UPF0104 family)